ncbi:putative glycoside hydrolase [Pendulispora albinea]|uniref:Glycoside hydrolase n=1 Tax=Pendulispora albinea TaxID=2741071 RepID=A0ABZ2M1G0_9BACT
MQSALRGARVRTCRHSTVGLGRIWLAGLALLAPIPPSFALSACGGGHASTRPAEAEHNAHLELSTVHRSDGASSGNSALPEGPRKPAEEPEKRDKRDPRAEFRAWLEPRIPKGGAIEAGGGEAIRVVHTIDPKDTHLSIAKAYLDITDVYLADDLAAELKKKKPRLAGTVEIPHLLSEPYKDAEHDRLGWPEDKALRGIFLVGAMAAKPWIETLDRLVAHGMNAVVLDGKDYMGPVTYPSKVPVAIETGATKKAPIADLARAIRFAHARGVRVIMRNSCFHDPWAAVKAPRLSIRGKWGGPYPVDWLDPANEEAQNYIVELTKEEIDAGADEIQLDYVRFPVQRGLGNAVLPPPDGSREKVIVGFVRKVHEVTKARGVPLSLDIFGVTATGTITDVHNLGQDIALLGPEVEALSPMTYPAHYDKGFMGWDAPGTHPEIVGIGTRETLAKLSKVNGAKGAGGDNAKPLAVVRPWLQAFGWRAPNYGPKYLLTEAAEAEKAGSTGWLMWNPGCNYAEAWRGFPLVAKERKERVASTRD